MVEVKDLPKELLQVQDFSAEVTADTATPVAATRDSPALTPPIAPAPSINPSQSPNGINSTNTDTSWLTQLEAVAASMLADGQSEVMDALGRQFESTLIRTALKHTHGRKNDAAIRLGIGRNTITRKIQELGIDGARED
jgi:two-component system nitrogen regulation response regulator GlnG